MSSLRSEAIAGESVILRVVTSSTSNVHQHPFYLRDLLHHHSRHLSHLVASALPIPLLLPPYPHIDHHKISLLLRSLRHLQHMASAYAVNTIRSMGSLDCLHHLRECRRKECDTLALPHASEDSNLESILQRSRELLPHQSLAILSYPTHATTYRRQPPSRCSRDWA